MYYKNIIQQPVFQGASGGLVDVPVTAAHKGKNGGGGRRRGRGRHGRKIVGIGIYTDDSGTSILNVSKISNSDHFSFHFNIYIFSLHNLFNLARNWHMHKICVFFSLDYHHNSSYDDDGSTIPSDIFWLSKEGNKAD